MQIRSEKTPCREATTPQHRLLDPLRRAGSARWGRQGRVRRRGWRAGRLTAVLAWAITTLCLLPAAAHGGQRPAADCGAGQLCLWSDKGYSGRLTTHELLGVTTGECTPLPEGAAGGSFVNLTGRPVTVYQSGVCDTTGDFHTYPSGSWVPEAPYAVRAFTLWER